MERNDSVKVAVSKVIPTYLRIIKKNIPLVIDAKHPNALHDLRVYIRRLRNAFWVFKSLFPKRLLKKWNRSLRGVSQQSSLARDLDVHAIFLQNYIRKVKARSQSAELKFLINAIKKERGQTQSALVHSIGSFKDAKTLEEIGETLKQLKRLDELADDFGSLFKKKMSKLLKQFLQYESYVYRPRQLTKLHEMRIAAKRIRYALEGFQFIFKKRTTYFLVFILQFHRLLGEIHDFDVWTTEILPKERRRRRLNATDRKVIDDLILHCQKLREVSYQQFVALWERSRREKVWIRFRDFIRQPT